MSDLRIQKRKYSSNIVEKNIGDDEKPKWIPYIAPLIKKEEGQEIEIPSENQKSKKKIASV